MGIMVTNVDHTHSPQEHISSHMLKKLLPHTLLGTHQSTISTRHILSTAHISTHSMQALMEQMF